MKHLLFFCLTLASSVTYSQGDVDSMQVDITLFQSKAVRKLTTRIYKTYDNYVSRDGKKIGQFESFDNEYSGDSLKLACYDIKDSSIVEFNLTGYWGFTVGNDLFRLQSGYPFYAYDKGKIVYYESGTGKLRSYSGGSGWTTELNSLAQFSLDLESKIVGARKATKFYGRKRTDLKEICRCIDKGLQTINSMKMVNNPKLRASTWISDNRKCMNFN